MKLMLFENETGEGLVSFERESARRADSKSDPEGWFQHVLVAGERIFEYGCPCGTCGIVFRKVGSPAHRVSDSEAIRLLGNLESTPDRETLIKLARVLEPGSYYPVVVEGAVTRVEPGAPNDYFASDTVRLFGPNHANSAGQSSPSTTYYRFGADFSLNRNYRRSGPHRALVTAVVMPLHDPTRLDRERIDFWLRQAESARPLTAWALAVIDRQSPATKPPDTDYPYEEQFLFSMCLLDGHHRVQAAAESGAVVRILSLVAINGSSIRSSEDISAVLQGYRRRA